MIRFACPRCKAVLERPDNVAGTKFACPSCGQRLQVPLPPENKTVLGSLVRDDLPASPLAPAPSPSAPAADAEVRRVAGRDHLFWCCPLCKNQVDVALDLGQSTVRCPHCSKKIGVPQALPPQPALPEPAAALPATAELGATEALPPTVAQTPSSAGTGEKPTGPIPFAPPPLPPARARRRAPDYEDDDDEDDDFPSIQRRSSRRGRYSREVSARAASTGLVCSIISMGLLLVTFVLWTVTAQTIRGRVPDREPLAVIIFLVVLGSFVLSLLGIIFSSRGLDESNNYNRGQATAGLVCGIISLVVGSIVGLLLICVGLIFFSVPGGRW